MVARRRLRMIIVQGLYQHYLVGQPLDQITRFTWLNRDLEPADRNVCAAVIAGIVDREPEIDEIIKRYSQNWSVDRVELLTLIILRMCIFALENMPDWPPRVVIDEGLELTHSFVGQKAVPFVNGILDAYYRTKKADS